MPETATVKKYTQFQMRDIIKRCLKECEQTGSIKAVKNVNAGPNLPQFLKIIENQDDVADHVSKTLIGELLEFELIRRWAPIFREFYRSDSDLAFISSQQAEHHRMLGMRTKIE